MHGYSIVAVRGKKTRLSEEHMDIDDCSRRDFPKKSAMLSFGSLTLSLRALACYDPGPRTAQTRLCGNGRVQDRFRVGSSTAAPAAVHLWVESGEPDGVIYSHY
jgi:hypothetical protein